MAKWQDTFEELKKKKKDMDKTSTSSERKQVNNKYSKNTSYQNNLVSTKNNIDRNNIAYVKNTNVNNSSNKINTSYKEKNKDKKWYQQIFNKGAFDDGYDFGDVTKTILGTATDLTQDVSKGITSILEAPLDIGTNAVASVQDKLGYKDAAEKTRKFANRDLSDTISSRAANSSGAGILYNILTGTPENIVNPVGLKYNKDQSLKENVKGALKDTFLEDVKDDKISYEKNSLSGYYADKTAELVGYTLGLAYGGGALSKATGTAGAGITTKAGTTALGGSISGGNIGVTIAGKTLNLPTLAILGGVSSGLQEANSKEGVTEAERWTKSLSGGAIEGITEGLFGMFGIGGNELTDVLGEKIAKKFTSSAGKTLAKVGFSSSGEATEEFLSYSLNYLVDNGLIDKMGKADFSQDWDWSEVGEQMALAFVSSAIMQGGSTKINTNEAIKTAEEQLGRKLTTEEKGEVTQAVIEGTFEEKYNKLQEQETENKNVQNTEKDVQNAQNIEKTVQNEEVRQENTQLNQISNQIQELENQLNTSQNATQQQEILNQINNLQQQYDELQQQEQVNQLQDNELPVKKANIEEVKPITTQETNSNLATEVESNTPNVVKSEQQDTIVNANTQNTKSEYKNKQLEAINKSNPADDSYHTWIRSTDDIKTFDEAFFEDGEYSGMDPDFTESMAQESKETGKITVYSSYPIENGVFVSPSQMEASQYAGGDATKLYSKEVNINDVAWIDGAEGQYAKVEDTQSGQRTTISGQEKQIQGLESYSRKEIKGITRGYIQEKLEENDLYDVEINDLEIIGSRNRGTAKENSDLDIVVEYTGDIREDDLFNILNEEPMYIDGVQVDINPINEYDSGTLKEFMERSNKYDKEVLSKLNENVTQATQNSTQIKSLEERVSGDTLLDVQDFIDEVKSVGAKVDKNGYVTVYHQTTNENAEKIKQTGKMSAKEPYVYFSTSKNAQQSEGRGTSKLEFKIPAEKLLLDDIFSDNADVKMSLKNVNDLVDVNDYLVRDAQSDTQTTTNEQEKPFSRSQESDTPTQQELDNLEDIRLNKSGSEYASAFYDLEKKYGKENLYKGLNEYKSTGKALNTEQVVEQVEDAIAPIKKSINELKETIEEVTQVAEETKVLREDLEAFYKQSQEDFKTISDNDIAPTMEYNTQGVTENNLEVESPLKNRDIDEVGDRKIKAYQYENPEVRPYFQQMAKYMLTDLSNSTKGERLYNDQVYYDTNGESGWFGTKRHTTSDIADLLDNYNYSYADIRKGLEAIIEDHGAENIAVAKRIEFALDERLRNGYTDVNGFEIPADQNYINLLQEKEFSDYYSSIPSENIAPFNENVEDSVNVPTNENVSKKPLKERYEAIEPNKANEDKYEDTPMIRIKPDREAFNKAVERTSKEVENELGYIPKNPTKESTYEELTDTSENQRVAQILTEEPKATKKKQRLWATMKANLLDKGAVFEDVSIKNKNRDLMGKWDYTLTSEARAQNVIGNGHTEYDASTKTTKQTSKSLNDIVAEVENTGLKSEFYDYMYHKHNVDRMNLEQRAKEKMFDLNNILKETTNETAKKYIEKQIKSLEKTVNKPVFGDSVTSDVSQRVVDQYENENPVFMDYAQDVYDYVNADRQQLVKEGVISQETADLWNEMYPHYVPIRRVDSNGNNIDVPLDTGRTGVNAPIKKATGGSSDILPLFDTMAMRTLQTYRATSKNSFGVELKNTLGTTIENQQTNIDEVIDSVDNQESLLQEGKNGSNPTFTVFENGEKVTYEITQDMYEALKPISESSLLSKTFKPFNKASNFHRGLLTEYNPVFMITNAVKDIQDVLINSQHTAKTYSKIPEAWAQQVKKGYWYQEYISNGGEQNSYFDSQENTFKTENKGIKKILDIPPLSTISKMNNFIEMTPRLAEYIASREQGRSVEVSMLDAARVTTNFKAGGNVTKWANRNGATFLNASVQGAMQQVRNIREANMNGLRGWANLATKFAMAGLPAILLNGLIWDDDDDYDELSDYVKQNYYVVWKKDDGTFIRIPKGRTVAVIQEAIQQIENAKTGDDEVDLKSFLDLVLTNLAPNNPIENNILSPITQVVNNKTWYGEDLVPTRLQNLPANEQYGESTDVFSKWLGDKINVSPVKINYLLNQYSGGVGDVVLPMITPKATNDADSLGDYLLAPFKDKFTTDAVMNNKNVGELFDTSEKLTKEANKSNATDEDVLKNKYINSIKKQMNDLYKEKREIQNSDLSKSEKYKQVREVQEKINSIAKEGMSKYNDGNYTNNYGIIDDKEYYLNSKGDWTAVKDDEVEELNSMNMSLQDKSKYFNAKNEISKIVKDYKGDKTDLNEEYEDDEDTLKDVMNSLSSEKKSSIINAITNTGLNDEQQAYLYKKYYNTDTIDTILDADIGVSTYFDYVQQEFKADYNSNGKVISGSRKDKVISYVNEYDLSVAQKAILIKSTNTFKFNDYNDEIVDYIDGLDIPYEDKVYIFKELDMTIDDNGYVHW